jgi:hypothetical protein
MKSPPSQRSCFHHLKVIYCLIIIVRIYLLSNKSFSPFHINNEEIPSPESYNYLRTNWNPNLKYTKPISLLIFIKKQNSKYLVLQNIQCPLLPLSNSSTPLLRIKKKIFRDFQKQSKIVSTTGH